MNKGQNEIPQLLDELFFPSLLNPLLILDHFDHSGVIGQNLSRSQFWHHTMAKKARPKIFE